MSITKTGRLMLFNGTMGIYCENHTEHMNTKCDKMLSFIMVQQLAHIFITVFTWLVTKFRLLMLYSTEGDGKGKGLPQQAEVAQGVPGRLRSRIFLTFGTTRVVGRQPYAPAAFTPGEIPGNHF